MTGRLLEFTSSQRACQLSALGSAFSDLWEPGMRRRAGSIHDYQLCRVLDTFVVFVSLCSNYLQLPSLDASIRELCKNFGGSACVHQRGSFSFSPPIAFQPTNTPVI